MKKKLAYAGALLALLVGALLTPQPASAQLGSLLVNITEPASGQTVSGTVTVRAQVTVIGLITVAGVRFTVDGNNIGEDSSSPYSVSWNTTGVANGSHQLRAVARSVLGLEVTSAPVTVTVNNAPPPDTTPPNVSITSPANGATVSETITISANASDNVGVAGVRFLIDGSNLGAEDTAAPYSVSWNTTGLANGSHTITAVARDAAGNTRTSAAVTVTVNNGPPPDTTPPSVSITSPANGATVSGTITVTANAADNIGVGGVQFFLDGTLGADDTSAPYSTPWNTTGAANGTHTITAVARDAAGNTRTSAPITVTVANDAVRPTVTINQAAGQADPSTASPINFTVVFSEAVSGFTGSDVTISGTAGGTKTVAVSGGPSTYTVAVSGMSSPGTVIASIAAGVAQDAAGNTNTASTSSDNTVSFDATGPSVTINQAAGQADPSTASPVNFTAVFSEAVSGFAASDVTISGTAGGTKTVAVSGGPSTYNVAVSGMTSPGTVIASIAAGVAQDAAGNLNTASTSTDNTVAFSVLDTTPPSASITSPANGATVSGTITVTASASDNVGVASVQFLLDGALIATDTSAPYSTSLNTAGAANGSHTLTAVARDAAGNTTTSASVTVTVFNGGAAVTRFEEGNPAVALSRNATTGAAEWGLHGPEVAIFSASTASISNVSGATATFSFTGTAVSWTGLRCNTCGIATVSIDGAAPVTVDTAGPRTVQPGLKSETLFAASGLAAGPHTLVITVTGTSTSGGSHIAVDAFDVAGPAASLIAVENLFPGTDKWQMSHIGFRPADDVGKQIKAYASATSVNKGEPITFHVTLDSAQQYTMDVYRMGWYQGLGGRFLQRIGPLPGVPQPACPADAATGLIECAWTPSHTLTVPLTWTSGVYLVHLTNAQGFQSYITFVVRDDARRADILYQQSVTTYQAYNNYPNDGATGKSIYDFNSRGANTVTGGPRAAKVSWNRPYQDDGSGLFLVWEYYFIRWLERSGYDATYSTNIDTHQNSARLRNSKAFLSVGHDEYWSKAMYDGVEQARDAGVSLGFFGANTIFWQVRFEASPLTGAADRVMVGYKDRSIDPVQGPTTTVLWRDPFVNRPEQRLIGVQFSGQLATNVPYVVTNSSSWVYQGTGLVNGDSIPGIVGYEADTSMPDAPLPNAVPGTYQILSQSPYQDVAGPSLIANSSIYQAPSGAWVFGSGTISWPWGLDLPGVADPRIQRATANLLNRFLGIPLEP